MVTLIFSFTVLEKRFGLVYLTVKIYDSVPSVDIRKSLYPEYSFWVLDCCVSKDVSCRFSWGQRKSSAKREKREIFGSWRARLWKLHRNTDRPVLMLDAAWNGKLSKLCNIFFIFCGLLTKKVKLGERNIIELITSCSILSFEGHRYPIINSGDTIALRLAYTSGSLSKNWMFCTTSYCHYTTCHGTFMKSSSWSSCSSSMIFKITAMGKMEGQPINSGDTVTLKTKNYGFTSSYHLRCHTSTSSRCEMVS